MRVIRERGANPGDVEAVTGIDDGQGFLKVAIIMIDTKEDEVKQEGDIAKYSEVCIFI